MSAATLNGHVNPENTACVAYFEYGLTAGYGTATAPQDIPSGGSDVPFEQGITDLAADTTYHFRAVAVNDSGIVYGADETFDTLPTPAISFADTDGVGYDAVGAVVAGDWSAYAPVRDATYSYTPDPKTALTSGSSATLVGPSLSKDIRNEFAPGWRTLIPGAGSHSWTYPVPKVSIATAGGDPDNGQTAGMRGYGTFSAGSTTVLTQPPGMSQVCGPDQRSTVVAKGLGSSNGILLGIEFVAYKDDAPNGQTFTPEAIPGSGSGTCNLVVRDVGTGAAIYIDNWFGPDGSTPQYVLYAQMAIMGMSAGYWSEAHITPVSDGTFWISPVQSAALTMGVTFTMLHVRWNGLGGTPPLELIGTVNLSVPAFGSVRFARPV